MAAKPLVAKPLRLFFIGNEFYWESGSRMSPIYEVGTKERYDWGLVDTALAEGRTVTIRPASDGELAWATRTLAARKEARR